jgi:hypothetical protein
VVALTDSDPSWRTPAAWIAKKELRTLARLGRADASHDVIDAQLSAFFNRCGSTAMSVRRS